MFRPEAEPQAPSVQLLDIKSFKSGHIDLSARSYPNLKDLRKCEA